MIKIYKIKERRGWIVVAQIQDFLLLLLPIIALIVALIGIVWSSRNNRKYLVGYILMLLGVGIHYYGLKVGAWEGMAISFVGGGGFVLLSLLILLITFIYTRVIVD